MHYFVFFLQRADGDITIGKANVNDFQSRLANITRQYGPVKALGVVEGNVNTERALHQQFAAYRRPLSIRRRNVNFWFAPVDELLQFITANCIPLLRVPSFTERTYKLVNE
jgi:hypothetical protein